jgi:glycosyltransferase involved in cell wall biosynthesis
VKIVLPVHHFPPRYSAGAELYTFRLARWLLANDFDAEVICIEAIDQGNPGDLAATQDRYQGVPVWRLAFNLIDAPERLRWNYDNPLLGTWFAEYLQRSQPDIVHFQAGYLIGTAPLEAALAAGMPTVLTLHDYWYLCPRITLLRGDGSLCTSIPDQPSGCAWCLLQDRRSYRAIDRASRGLAGKIAQAFALREQGAVVAERRASLLPLLAQPNAVIAPSRFLAERFAPFVAPERLHISRYGLDLAPFQGGRTSAATPLRIGFIGQIAPHKGVHLLIKAFRAIQPQGMPIELHIYGGLEALPSYVARLRQLAGKDERIHFHGRFDNSRAAEILGALAVAVVPSVWYENSPLAIMEAQAAGTPVITAALGGMAELVRHEVDGLHFAPADSTDLARQLQRLIDEPELLPKLRSGITMPRSIDEEMRQLLEIYQKTIGQPAAVLDSLAT